MSQTTANSASGSGVAGCLTIVFVLLKAFGLLDWSWWWVFSPLWIPAAFLAALALLALIALGIAFAITELIERRTDRWL